MQRRQFLALPAAALLHGAGRPIDAVLQAAVSPKGVPGVVAMVATSKEVTFQGAHGNVDLDALFRVHSMTKPVTCTAAMQLVEAGKLQLDAPVERYLPELANLKILSGFDANKQPILTPAKHQPTLRHVLSHSSGFGYSMWDEKLAKYTGKETPLLFEPGTRWQYGTSTDVVGRIVEKVSGKPLEEYFKANIFSRLGMPDTTYQPPPEAQYRVPERGARQPDGTWKAEKFPVPAKVNASGGGGLFTTAADYTKFMQMFLKGGQEVLKPESIAAMRQNQIGAQNVRKMMSTNQAITRDFGFHIEANDKFGFGSKLTPWPTRAAAPPAAWRGPASGIPSSGSTPRPTSAPSSSCRRIPSLTSRP
jgi:methyl acetate hydrolase